MRVDQELVMKAATVATSAPREWALFMKALKDYADAEARNCVAAPPEILLRMQGRAQQAAELSSLFEGAVKTADSIANKTAALNRR